MFSFIQDVLEWPEKHPGLGGWVGAVSTFIAIFVTWGLARAEYLRTRRQERTRTRAEIDLIMRIITDFETQVQRYKDLGQDNAEALSFKAVHRDDVDWHSMRDLASIPVTNWPTLDIYTEFKRYWRASEDFTRGETNLNKDLTPNGKGNTMTHSLR